MSREFWQTEKQMKQLRYGRSVKSRIAAYEKVWMDRCYSNGIPDGDEVPKALMEKLKVPSYKAIALCLLNNDLKLRKLGFSLGDSDIARQLEFMKKKEDEGLIELDLF